MISNLPSVHNILSNTKLFNFSFLQVKKEFKKYCVRKVCIMQLIEHNLIDTIKLESMLTGLWCMLYWAHMWADVPELQL